jgi:UDP-N-acetylmuramoyl-tripeptide--D-alanyl-D-alanine ligase
MPARVVGITGSNGKTTVKNLTAAILAQVGSCHANPGNRNNEVGLPLAVLDLEPGHRYAVFEMGAGKPGDIAYLAAIAQPHVGLVNNVGPAHLERLGSLEGVATTKGAVYEALPADGVAVINADDAFATAFERRVSAGRILRYGIDAPAQVGAQVLSIGEQCRFRLTVPGAEGEVVLPMVGRHNIANALAAAAIASALEVPFAAIRAGLEATSTVAGRLRLLRQPAGYALIDDTYNANPASVGAAIDTVVSLPGEPWLVLGDMGELGPQAEALHAQLGAQARAAGIARLFTVGALSHAASAAFGAGAVHFERMPELVEALRAALEPGVVCLVKGSRSAGMERVLAELGGLDHAA